MFYVKAWCSESVTTDETYGV